MIGRTIRIVRLHQTLTVNGRRVIDEQREGPADVQIDDAMDRVKKAAEAGDLAAFFHALGDGAAWVRRQG
jgi:hypothetical protein